MSFAIANEPDTEIFIPLSAVGYTMANGKALAT